MMNQPGFHGMKIAGWFFMAQMIHEQFVWGVEHLADTMNKTFLDDSKVFYKKSWQSKGCPLWRGY